MTPISPGSASFPALRPGVRVPAVDSHTVVLVEGESDRAAVIAAAALLGLDLVRLDVAVVSMGGVTNIRHHLRSLGATPARHRVLGLCDRAESAIIGRALAEKAELMSTSRSSDFVGLRSGDPILLAQHGFQTCDRDLEDELIRAVGTDAVIELIAATGELRAWHSMRQQPAQRGRPVVDQLRRWLGSGATRKIRYAPVLVAALTPDRLPAPLARLADQLDAR